METPQIPEDWTNRDSWNLFYEELLGLSVYVRAFWYFNLGTPTSHVNSLSSFVQQILAEGVRSVWIPGCGVNPLGYFLAKHGLDVVATDVSPAAVEYQLSRPREFEYIAAQYGLTDLLGTFTVEVHDFYDNFQDESFDLIINVKAIQGFPTADIERIARVHARALRPGRYAFFDTMNVQGERRDNLERVLANAGFFIPHAALNRWYRSELRSTGIPHSLRGNRPMPDPEEYEYQSPRYLAALAQLTGIETQFKSQLEAAAKLDAERIGPETKVARINYSTG